MAFKPVDNSVNDDSAMVSGDTGRPSRLALLVAFLVILSGFLTYGVLTGRLPFVPTPTILVSLLAINLSLGLILLAMIVSRFVKLRSDRKSGRAGAQLHVRLVATFSAIAVTPAILVAVFAAMTLNRGVEAWFSSHVRTALDGAANVAHLYMVERANGILKDASDIAYGLQTDPRVIDLKAKKVDIAMMKTRIEEMTKDHGLLATFIMDSHGVILGSSKPKKLVDPKPPKPEDFRQAAQGDIVIDVDQEAGVVWALVHLKALRDANLLILRYVDPKVFNYYLRTKDAVSEYRRLERDRSRFQLLFAAFYGVVSLVVLLAAIWLGLSAANRLVRPISRLIEAAGRVSDGDLKAQVVVERSDDEIGTLGLAFNRMTAQLETQRDELVAANRQIDERRRFTETVLAGVSAGVIGIGADGQVTIVNRAAARFLNAAPEELEGQHYSEAVPELAALIRRALQEPVRRAGGEVIVKRDGASRTLSVQVASEQGQFDGGYVATFDDITDLVSAQRTAAWADVARRIAHEIKNPLTPIQLSAERLKRKYSKQIETDLDIFQQCTDTIIRQVGDIGRMVDEFSTFARMPKPVVRTECAQELLHQAVFLQRVAHTKIAFETHMPKDLVHFTCDGRLISQALTNIIKNATEGIESRLNKGEDATPGKIVADLVVTDTQLQFKVTDNGIGLPKEERHRLTEPYVTTRAKGTGLGLAIVRKIMEDHGGELILTDASEEEHGACVILAFSLTDKTRGGTDEQAKSADRV